MANAYGIWSMIFVSNSKLIIGAAGLIGALLCLLLGVVTIYLAVSILNPGLTSMATILSSQRDFFIWYQQIFKSVKSSNLQITQSPNPPISKSSNLPISQSSSPDQPIHQIAQALPIQIPVLLREGFCSPYVLSWRSSLNCRNRSSG